MSILRRAALALLVSVVLFGAACTPEQQAIYAALDPASKAAVDAHYRGVIEEAQRNAAAQSRDCNQAIDRHWPGDKARAKRIVHRESRNNPAAANPRSSARGCFQLLQSLHAHRYGAVGCSSAQWANPDCSTKAAWHLYREAGWSPWRVG